MRAVTPPFMVLALLLCTALSQDQSRSGAVGIEKGRLINQVKPVYPNEARRAGIEGDVILQAKISKEGDIVNLQLISGHPMLVDAAITAVKQWKYEPYRKNGEPIEVDTQIKVNFALDKGVTAGPYSSPSEEGTVVGGIIGSVTSSGATGARRVRISAGVAQGLLLSQVKPDYPPSARQAMIEGTVTLQAQIDKGGNVVNVQLVSGHPLLAPAAIQAVRHWKYIPYLLNGYPVAVDTQIQVNFTLADNPANGPPPAAPESVPPATANPPNPQVLESGWRLAWSDEFNGPNGSPPDPTKWTLETGGNGWGNKELEYYTDRLQNAYQQDGNLVIKVLAESFTGADGVTRNYTSARLKTLGKFSQAYGRFEARIKIPRGQGIWPAFWMLGADIGSVGWPDCGEIDIMENIGKEPGLVHGTLHGPGYSGDHAIGAPFGLGTDGAASDQNFADEFHVYTVEWEPQAVRFYVDDHLYETRTPADVPAGAKWVYDHPFFILLNVAVGGGWPGNPDATSTYPQTMLVDYVRVYGRGEKIQVTPAQR